MNYDIERSRQESEEIRKVFRELFPLADENHLPYAACHIKGFLRDRIKIEADERCFHREAEIVRVLAEVSPPKTHLVDMARIVVKQALLYRAGRDQYEKLADLTAERDEMKLRLDEIGAVCGCNHTNDPDGRLKLVKCVQDLLRPPVWPDNSPDAANEESELPSSEPTATAADAERMPF